MKYLKLVALLSLMFVGMNLMGQDCPVLGNQPCLCQDEFNNEIIETVVGGNLNNDRIRVSFPSLGVNGSFILDNTSGFTLNVGDCVQIQLEYIRTFQFVDLTTPPNGCDKVFRCDPQTLSIESSTVIGPCD